MSNYLFSGYEFNSELKADFKLQNLLQSQVGEDQQMSLKLLNRQSEGFVIGAKTPHGQTPQFVLDQIIGGSAHNIITLDSATSQLGLNFNVDLGNSYKVTNSIVPTDDGDLANKLYVDNLNRIKSIGINTNTDALTITENTDPNDPIFNIDLSSVLQNLSSLSGDGLVLKTATDTFDTIATSLIDDQVLTSILGVPTWKSLNRVTSIGVTTASTGLNVTNTPVTSEGNINIDLSTSLENIGNLSSLGLVAKDGVDTFYTVPNGLAGQFLGVDANGDLIWSTVGTVTSVGVTGGDGITVSGSPITTNGNIGLTLDANLESLANLATDGVLYKTSNVISALAIPATNGQIIQSNNGSIEWITPASGGNVTGTGTSTLNSLPQITNTTTTAISPSNVLVENNTNLNIPGFLKVDTVKNTNDQNLFSYNSGDDRIYLNKPLRIPDGVAFNQQLAYGYLNSSGNTGTGSGFNSYSIDCHFRVAAQEFNAHSSRTIKNIKGRNEEIIQEALNFFEQLDIVKYQYKDIIKEGDHEYFGVIAEELKEVLPHYVNDHHKFIPNIYCKGMVSKVVDEYWITIDEELPDIKGDKVQVYTDDKCLELEITHIGNSIISITTDTELPEEVFVYGTYEYSPTVAYNKLWGLGFVALKGIKNKMEFLEEQVQKLTSQIKQLTNQGV
jgi:hypothetical protein